jgi:hypothetical protein
MWKPTGIALTLCVVLHAAGRGDETGGPAPKPGEKAGSGEAAIVQGLIRIARDSPSLVSRAAALDALANLRTKDKEAAGSLKKELHEFLKAAAAGTGQQRFLLPYVVQAIGSLGPDARDLLPDLVAARGADSRLDAAIDAAVPLLLKPEESPPLKTAKEVQQQVQSALSVLKPEMSDYVSTWAEVLTKQKDPTLRVIAAKSLGLARKDEAADALLALSTITDADDDLKAVAEHAIRKLKPGP